MDLDRIFSCINYFNIIKIYLSEFCKQYIILITKINYWYIFHKIQDLCLVNMYFNIVSEDLNNSPTYFLLKYHHRRLSQIIRYKIYDVIISFIMRIIILSQSRSVKFTLSTFDVDDFPPIVPL